MLDGAPVFDVVLRPHQQPATTTRTHGRLRAARKMFRATKGGWAFRQGRRCLLATAMFALIASLTALYMVVRAA